MFQDFKPEIKTLLIVALVAVVISVGGISLLKTMQSPPGMSDPALSEVEGWQTYRNEKYGFEIKYPPSWKVYEEYGQAASNFVFTGDEGVYSLQIISSAPKTDSDIYKFAKDYYPDAIIVGGDFNGYEAVRVLEKESPHPYRAYMLFRDNISFGIGAFFILPGDESLDSRGKLMNSTFKFTKEVAIGELDIGLNSIGSTMMRVYDITKPVQEIDGKEEAVVLDKIDKRISIRKESTEDSLELYGLYYGDQKVDSFDPDYSDSFPLRIFSFEHNDEAYMIIESGPFSGDTTPSATHQVWHFYFLDTDGLWKLTDAWGNEGGLLVLGIGDKLIIHSIFTGLIYAETYADSTDNLVSVKDGKVTGELPTETCYTSLSDRGPSLQEDMLFECDFQPNIFFSEEDGQLHIRVRNVTREGEIQNSYFLLSGDGSFIKANR